MAVNIDTSGLQFFLKAVIINIKRLINRCIDSYNSLFQLDPENAREIHNELGDDLEKRVTMSEPSRHTIKQSASDLTMSMHTKALALPMKHKDCVMKRSSISRNQWILNRETAD